MNQALSFGLLGVGGLALTKALTGSSWADVVKGRVRSEAALERACADVSACIEAQGWTTLGIIPSPILGGGGAREFLIAARHG